MNINKLIQVVYFIIQKYNFKINYTKLIKILYLSDREALAQSGDSITDNSTVNMRNGPVLSELYDLIKGAYLQPFQDEWNQHFVTEDKDLVCINKEGISDGELCEFEEEILNFVDSKYHGYEWRQMISEVHKKEICPEWFDTGRTSVSIPTERILQYLGYSKEQCDIIKENKDIYTEEFKKLKVKA